MCRFKIEWWYADDMEGGEEEFDDYVEALESWVDTTTQVTNGRWPDKDVYCMRMIDTQTNTTLKHFSGMDIYTRPYSKVM